MRLLACSIVVCVGAMSMCVWSVMCVSHWRLLCQSDAAAADAKDDDDVDDGKAFFKQQ